MDLEFDTSKNKEKFTDHDDVVYFFHFSKNENSLFIKFEIFEKIYPFYP